MPTSFSPKSFIEAVSSDNKQHYSICWIQSHIHAERASGTPEENVHVESRKALVRHQCLNLENLHLFFKADAGILLMLFI